MVDENKVTGSGLGVRITFSEGHLNTPEIVGRDIGLSLLPAIRTLGATPSEAHRLVKTAVSILRPTIRAALKGRPPVMVDIALDDLRGAAWAAICADIDWKDRQNEER